MKKDKKTLVEPMDERQLQIEQKAFVYGFYFLYVWSIITTVYQIVTTGEFSWEMLGFVGASAVVVISRWRMGFVDQPFDRKYGVLPTGASKREKRVRCTSYVRSSMLFAFCVALIEVVFIAFREDEFLHYNNMAQHIMPNLSNGPTLLIAGVIAFVHEFVLKFVVLLPIFYLIGEFCVVRRYNRSKADLDYEEMDLDEKE